MTADEREKIPKLIWIAAAIGIGIVILLMVSQPLPLRAVLAKYKSMSHFLVLQEDPRIRYEESAERNARTLLEVLPGSRAAVEHVLNAPFRRPIDVYVCASQESFNQYVFLSRNARGAVYWGKLFLSPGAFSPGYLPSLIKHELTHYLFQTHLGEKRSIDGIPLWFREGVALSENGSVNWILYRIGALMVHFLHDTEPERFDLLIQSLLSGEHFDSALAFSFGHSVDSVMSDFSSYLQDD